MYIDKSKQNIIKPAISYIHEHYTTEALNISKLALMCGITPEYFRRLFHIVYGVSPIKYINQLKLARAVEVLLSGMCSITDAALLSGYNDISYFNREFKKAHGLSPTAFINRHRA